MMPTHSFTLFLPIYGATIFALSAAPALAQTPKQSDHGHIMMQLKTPKTGCKFITIDLIDSSRKSYTPNGNKSFLSEIAKQQEKNKFTDIHKFHVKSGNYKLKNIKCTTGGNKLELPIQFSPTSSRLLPKSIRTTGNSFNISSGKDIYIGALDFVEYNPENSWPLALDKSQEAIEKGQLKAGTFTKEFLTMEIDFNAIQPSKDITDTNVSADGHPPQGKGELAVQFKSSYACRKAGILFTNLGDPKAKKIHLKIKDISKKDGTGVGTKKVSSGRYEFSSAYCELHNRTLSAPALARSYVDVYPDEISYAGEIKQVNEIALSLGKVGKYRYEFSSKFDEAKNLVKSPERLVDRSATMTDSARLAVTGLENAMNRLNKQWNTIATNYQKRIEKYEGEIIPGYQE